MFIFLFGIGGSLYAQYDSLYIKVYNDKFFIKPTFSVRSSNIDLNGKTGREFNNIKYSPNGNSYYGVGVYLYGLNLELSTKFPSSWQRSVENFGSTNSFDFRANIYTRKIALDFAYLLYQGFFLAKPQNHDPNWESGDPHPQRSDLGYENLYINAYYIFNNKRFSMRSSYNQSEKQLRSVGSPLIAFTFADVKIHADSTLFPDKTVVPQKVIGFNYADFLTYAVIGGYSYNFLYKNFYLNGTFSIGPGIQNREIRPDFIKEQTILTLVYNFRAAIGYNTDLFFGGVSTVNNYATTDLEEIELSIGSSNLKVFFGFRFIAKNIFHKKRSNIPVEKGNDY